MDFFVKSAITFRRAMLLSDLHLRIWHWNQMQSFEIKVSLYKNVVHQTSSQNHVGDHLRWQNNELEKAWNSSWPCSGPWLCNVSYSNNSEFQRSILFQRKPFSLIWGGWRGLLSLPRSLKAWVILAAFLWDVFPFFQILWKCQVIFF